MFFFFDVVLDYIVSVGYDFIYGVRFLKCVI